MGERFLEVYVRASVEECERRDVKGLYERARSGEIQAFTGVSDPYEEPLAAELLIETEQESPRSRRPGWWRSWRSGWRGPSAAARRA